MVRILFVLLALYLLYRVVRWFKALQNPLRKKRVRPTQKGKILDQMKPCPHCGTYNPTQIAYLKNGLYFCNQHCHESYLKHAK